ncbi:MAG: sialate O-acetylesterase [Puniceicoccaceae bacterium]
MKYLKIFAVVCILSNLSNADVSLARLFCDHMVLQQNTENAIWGWAEPGEQVRVTASWGATASAIAGGDGAWKLFIETPGHGTGHSLTVKASNRIHIDNVAIGEVWLCAGQSNMGWSVANSFEAEGEANVDLPNFRIFKSQREHWHEPLNVPRDRLSRWKPCNPESAAETSAVSYYFGKMLHQKLGIPVGIIQQAFAGTPVEGWMPWEVQKDIARSQLHRAELDETVKRQTGRQGMDPDKALATFANELAAYHAKIDAGETMQSAARALQPPIITKPANLGHQYPSNIFNAMIYPVRPYGIRGMIWYQGERNSKDVPQAIAFREQLERMISYYRSSWHALSGGNVPDNFPFQMTQLPSWNPPQQAPVEGLEASWAVNRESMRLVAQNDPDSFLAVTIDTGDIIALHPKNKKPIGLRHAWLALANTYGMDVVGSGPELESQKISGNKVVLKFTSTGSGLTTAREGELNAFAIAGKDKVWHWAKARIDGNSVVLTSSKISKPVAVRYAWALNPSQRNLLYNREGFPASPFRTDDWPLFSKGDPIVTVNKPAKPDGYESTDWVRPQMNP